NVLTNVVRAQPSSQPFVPTHAYPVEDVLDVFARAGFPAAHVMFHDHGDLSSLIVLAERPLERRRGDPVASERAPEQVDVVELIASTSSERLLASADQYFASLTDWDHHLAKPFGSVDEAPWLLTHLAVVLQALHLKPGSTVLEFGAGTG